MSDVETAAATLGCSPDEVRMAVTDFIASEEYGISVVTHSTCDGLPFLEKTRNLYDNLFSNDEFPRNLLEDEELNEKLEAWLGDALDAQAVMKSKGQFSGDNLDFSWEQMQRLLGDERGAVIHDMAGLICEAGLDLDTACSYGHDVLTAAREFGLLESYDGEEIKDEVESEFTEGLSYWTIYWMCDGRANTEIARKCGLMAFEFEGDQYLALGGCGMDLSPKLDAYHALDCGRIDKDSQFFRQREYFEYVVGKPVTDEVDNATRLEEPRIIVNVPFHKR